MATEIIERAAARASGLTRYFTGKPCKHGHVAERVASNGRCIVCLYDAEKRYIAAHPEKIREKRRDYERNAGPERRAAHKDADKRWRDANADKNALRKKLWDVANPDRRRKHGKKWRDANPEKIRVKNKRYKAENAERLAPIALERTRQWEKDNPEKAAENHRVVRRRRRARIAGIEGDHTRSETDALLRAQRFICAEPTCGADIHKRRHLDHIHPIARGGSNGIENLQWLCPSCNRRKGARDPAEWAQINGRLL
jgi:5-methylcytosine-specific restriction endonuclease McrA